MELWQLHEMGFRLLGVWAESIELSKNLILYCVEECGQTLDLRQGGVPVREAPIDGILECLLLHEKCLTRIATSREHLLVASKGTSRRNKVESTLRKYPRDVFC